MIYFQQLACFSLLLAFLSTWWIVNSLWITSCGFMTIYAPPLMFTACMHCARESRKKLRERERENKGPAQTETMPCSLRVRWLLAAHNQAHWVPLPSSPWYPLQTVSCFMSAIRQIMGCSVTDVNDSPACAIRPWCWQRAACMAIKVPVQHHLDQGTETKTTADL